MKNCLNLVDGWIDGNGFTAFWACRLWYKLVKPIVFRKNIMDEIREIKRCIEILADDTKSS